MKNAIIDQVESCALREFDAHQRSVIECIKSSAGGILPRVLICIIDQYNNVYDVDSHWDDVMRSAPLVMHTRLSDDPFYIVWRTPGYQLARECSNNYSGLYTGETDQWRGAGMFDIIHQDNIIWQTTHILPQGIVKLLKRISQMKINDTALKQMALEFISAYQARARKMRQWA